MAFDKEKTLAAAQKFVDKDQHDKAIKEYLKIIDVDPKDIRVLLNIATCYEQSNRIEDAGGTYYKVYEIYRAENSYQKGLAILKQAQRCLPDDDDIAMSMAEVYSALGLPHEAVAQLEKSLERAEKQNNSYTYAKILQMMVRVDSENIETRLKYAKLLIDGHDIDGASRQYSLALAQLLSKERYVEYIQTSRDYLKIAPKDCEVLENLAAIYVRMNRFSDAMKTLAVLTEDERTPGIREQLITCLTKTGHMSDALKELKGLAHQYEAQEMREDIIESVWLRAQKIAPNDPEVLSALGEDDVPILSESALNVVMSPAMKREQAAAQAAPVQNHAAGDDALNRMLSAKFDDAVVFYRQGNLDNAKALCMQIIANNEEFLPALKLLSQILDQQNDLVTLAQIERKIARVIFDTSPNEAIQHVLRAEECTPRAWENFNLMLVFGVEPSEYGFSAPETSVSNPRIPSAQIQAAIAAQSTPKRPAPPPPPMPRPGIPAAPPPIKPAVPPANMPQHGCSRPTRQISNDIVNEIRQEESARVQAPAGIFSTPHEIGITNREQILEVSGQIENLADGIEDAFDEIFSGGHSSDAAHAQPAHPMRSASQQAQTPYGYSGVPSGGQPAPAIPQHAVSGGAPRLQSAQPGSPAVTSSQRLQAVPQHAISASSPRLQAVPQRAISPSAQRLQAVPQRAISASSPRLQAVPQRAISPSAQRLQAVPHQSPAVPGAPRFQSMPQRPASPSSARFQAVPSAQGIPAGSPRLQPAQRMDASQRMGLQAPAFAADPAASSASTGSYQPVTPPVPAAAAPHVPQTAPAVPLTEDVLQKIQDDIQEIEFYAGMGLVDDAARMLTALVEKYGDLDIIHDARMRLGV